MVVVAVVVAPGSGSFRRRSRSGSYCDSGSAGCGGSVCGSARRPQLVRAVQPSSEFASAGQPKPGASARRRWPDVFGASDGGPEKKAQVAGSPGDLRCWAEGLHRTPGMRSPIP